VEVTDGDRGEFTVLADGQTVAQKSGDSLPDVQTVLAAVRKGQPAHAK
jgi:hypothetical protein